MKGWNYVLATMLVMAGMLLGAALESPRCHADAGGPPTAIQMDQLLRVLREQTMYQRDIAAHLSRCGR